MRLKTKPRIPSMSECMALQMTPREVYLLALETGHKVELSDVVRLLPRSQQRDVASPKPSPS